MLSLVEGWRIGAVQLDDIAWEEHAANVAMLRRLYSDPAAIEEAA